MAFRSYFSSAEPTAESSPETIKFEGRNLKLTKLIAEGGFSYVYFGDFGGQTVAVKKILTPDKAAGEAVASEIDLLSRLNHRNIVKLLGVKTSNVENYIIMEYCCPLSQTEGEAELVGNVFRQCCNAVEYMHNLGIAHRDVKLENFLIGADGFVKLVDFGSATREIIKPSIEWNATQRGIVEEKVAAKTTPMYRSPEIVDLWLNYQIDTRVDLWALGCLLYLLNYGTHPFPDSAKLAIINAKYSLRTEDSFTPIIRGLLQPNPDDRMDFETIFNRLSGVSITKLEFKQPVAAPVQEVKKEEKSLFSSLRGGAESLFKNLKENIREMTTELPVASRSDAPPSRPEPPRLATQASFVPFTAPPPRPPKPSTPSPQTTRADIPSENEIPDNIQPPPRPPRQSPLEDQFPREDSSTGNEEETEGILLDFGDSQTNIRRSQESLRWKEENRHAPNNGSGGQNMDLLADLFGTTESLIGGRGPALQPKINPISQLVNNDDIFGEFTVPVLNPEKPGVQIRGPVGVGPTFENTTNTSSSKGRNILDELDLFGNDITTSIPTSSSFSSLAQLKPERIVKNVSTPNLTDLVSDKERSHFTQPPPVPVQSQSQSQRQPNYSRSAFEPPNNGQDQNRKSNLNDVFGEFLKSEGFSVSSNSKNQTIQEMRKQEMVNSGMDPVSIKVNNWKEGKTKNIRALLSSLHTITWPECNWQEISMAEMVTMPGVKKSYRKACLAIHPDKQVGSEHEALAKAIFIELNEAWSAFEEIK